MNFTINIKQAFGTSNPSYLTDDDLVQGCIRGEDRATKMLYERFAPKMLSICKRYTARSEDAKDLMHDGFIKVFTKIDTFRGTAKLETWITRIMINNAINAIKKQVMVEWDDRYSEQTSDVSIDFEELYQKDIHYDAVLSLMKQLPLGYRTILNLYSVEEFSHKEIAEMLQISEGTSKSQLNRARTALKKLLRKEGWDEKI